MPATARYQLGEVLGRGGMGEVVSAHDSQIGRSVAIKRMRSEHADPSAVARFLREAQIQGKLEHPAVVPVHELWRDERGQPSFVMKQLAGVTLGDVLAKLTANDPVAVKEYPRQRLLRAFADVCLAIEFAHTRGVVHRDLKPANIVIGDFGEVYVLDWGIARIVGSRERDEAARRNFDDVAELDTGSHATVAGAMLGTPGYMAPEQIRGDTDLDGRADVYALGCMLFEILALAPLHPRGTEGLASTLAGVSVRPSIVAPEREIAPELDAICLAATMFERNDRYATAREIGEGVQRFLDGDRDLAMRREIVRTEMAVAHAALAKGNRENERRIAIRAAARALALDPTDRDPADLVARLMLEPPDEVPPEVEKALIALDLAALVNERPLLAISAFSFIAFMPVFLWAGIHAWWLLGVGAALAVGIGLISVLPPRENMFAVSRVVIVGWFGLVAVFALLIAPPLIAPGLGVVVAMAAATHRRVAPGWMLVLACTAAVLVPWLLGDLGVIDNRIHIVSNTFVMDAPTDHLNAIGAKVGLMLYTPAMATLAVSIASQLARDRRNAQRTTQIQAWQLRQLVPRPTEE